MIFQFNPADFLIECSNNGELIITVCRPDYIAPKIRYNLHDKAQVIPMKELYVALHKLNLDTKLLVPPRTDLPLLFHYGRADMTVSFFGSNITPNDVQETLYKITELADVINSFCLCVEEDQQGGKQLVLSLEMQQGKDTKTLNINQLQFKIFDQLASINQDFREAKRMLTDLNQTIIRLYIFATGPFENSDTRIKAKYIR